MRNLSDKGGVAKNAKGGSGKSEGHIPSNEMGLGIGGYGASNLPILFSSILRCSHFHNGDKPDGDIAEP
jgi:hypothetical protein